MCLVYHRLVGEKKNSEIRGGPVFLASTVRVSVTGFLAAATATALCLTRVVVLVLLVLGEDDYSKHKSIC